MCAKHYENPKMLSKVTAKNVGDVFLRHTVVMGRSHLPSLTFSIYNASTSFPKSVRL